MNVKDVSYHLERTFDTNIASMELMQSHSASLRNSRSFSELGEDSVIYTVKRLKKSLKLQKWFLYLTSRIPEKVGSK